jgi:hypothetical protein
VLITPGEMNVPEPTSILVVGTAVSVILGGGWGLRRRGEKRGAKRGRSSFQASFQAPGRNS